MIWRKVCFKENDIINLAFCVRFFFDLSFNRKRNTIPENVLFWIKKIRIFFVFLQKFYKINIHVNSK